MSQQVKQKAAEIDELIRRNAAAAQDGEAADESVAPDETVVEDEDTQQVAEVVELDSGPQEDAGVDSAIDDTLAQMQAQLEEANKRAATADQRWRSLDGQLRSKDEQIDRLTDLVGKMTEARAEPAEPPAPAGATSADSENFGADMIDMVQRVARQIAQAEIATLKQTLDGLSQTVDTVSQNTAVAMNESFEAKLTRLAPRWQDFDRDQGFHDWLNETGSRSSMFQNAAQSKDAEMVAEMFNMYTTLVEAKAATEQAAVTKKANKLEQQVAPGKSRSTATPASTGSADKKQWTRTEIAQAYNNKSRGQISKEDWAVLEAEIAAAQREGRVDYDR